MKILGYIIAIIGIIILATGVIDEAKTFVETSLKLKLDQINDITIIIAGIIVVLIGIFIIYKSPYLRPRRKGIEVPIYHGRNIVGYRRH